MKMNKSDQTRHGVRRAYSEAATRPQDEHPFPVGQHFAASIGYPPDLLGGLPAASVDAFSGVSNVAVFADIPMGAIVLDLGCGAGLDSLIAAQRVGPKGRMLGVDFSKAMLLRARRAAIEAGIANTEFCAADAEYLPIRDGLIDVALINGIFNLNPVRHEIFNELARVLRPGGVVYAAELILREPLPPKIQDNETDWFA